MRKVSYYLLLALVATSVIGCGGSRSAQQDDDDMVEQKQRAPEFYALAEKINKGGGVAEVAFAESEREDFAEQKAIIEAQRLISQRYETKVAGLTKRFAEEVSGNTSKGGAEINELFSNTIKASTKTVLQGATKLKPPKTFKSKKSGKFTCYVVYGIDPDNLNQSIMDQAKTNPKLYERFRASQAFQDLQKEMEAYDGQ